MIDGEKENNIKAPNIEKIQNHKTYRNPPTCVSGYMKSVKSRDRCTRAIESDSVFCKWDSEAFFESLPKSKLVKKT